MWVFTLFVVISWQEGTYCAWQFDWINQPAAHKIARYIFPKYFKPFPSKGLSTITEQKTRRPLRSERFFRFGHIYFDLVVFRMSDYAWKTNFWCHILIDGLRWTNLIALLLSFCGRTELGKMFGINCRRFLFSAPPPHFCPIFCSPKRAPSRLSRFFDRSFPLFELRLEKERKRLLRRLGRLGYFFDGFLIPFSAFSMFQAGCRTGVIF